MPLGIVYALLAYVAWGLLPLYWKLFASMESMDILAFRVLWSFIFVVIVIGVTRRWKEVRQVFSNRQTTWAIVAGSLLISSNWLLFIWAVNHGQVVETSLGYYMNPLLNVVIAVVFLKEKLNRGQWTAIGLALIGVIVLTVSHGSLPWISLSLALTFALYSVVKKKIKADAMPGLAGETAIVLPIAVIYLLFSQSGEQSAAATLNVFQWVMLILSGAATAMPLYWFALAAKRLPLTIVGLVQYVAPSISLMLGVLVFKETFTTVHAVSFAMIWLALVIFTWSSLVRQSKMQQAKLDA
ncbi:EamA family transporter RarD [Paenibacillus thalictri]|uniref:EamA family transporter RarD n=1 Tax=Paenibacillus thalictri TaxID=2527873 RepID=A0A4Q9DVL8_9BACL|nr:EamA family transporter RarD [Paenibacillus thalictri]TBL80405.1 EamA family transporter RarD [Paenibacillus thalictri]